MIINMNGAKAPETPSPVMQEKTVTPETLPTVIGPDEGYDGLSQVTVNPDADLKAENIKDGVSIFGVGGSYGKKFVDGYIDVGGGADVTSDKTFTFDVDFSEYPRQLTFNYPADIPQGMLLDPTTVKCNRPDFLLPARVPEHLTWMGVTGKSPWHMFNTQRGHKPDSFPYVITPAKEFTTMEDPVNGSKWTRTFTMTYDQEVVNAPDNLAPENIKAGVTIAGIEGTYEPQPSQVTLETVVTTPESFPTVVTPSAGYDGLSRVTVHSPNNLTAENIKSGVSIAGVTGTYEAAPAEPTLQSKTVTPASLPMNITADDGYDGLSQVTVNPDSQLIPENIRSGKTVFGVTGTFEGGGNAELDEFKKLFHGTNTNNTVSLTTGMFDVNTYIDPKDMFWYAHCNNIDLRGFSNILSSDNNKGTFYGIYAFDITTNNSWHGHVHIECTMFNGAIYGFSDAYLYDLPTVIVDGVAGYRAMGMYKGAKFHSDNPEIVIDGSSALVNYVFQNTRTYDPVSETSGAVTFRFKNTFTGVIHGSSTIGNASYPSNIIMESATPPTMNSSSGFIASGINTITVPKGALSNYQNATNWSNYADKMVEASE